jgi:hypothetical protein
MKSERELIDEINDLLRQDGWHWLRRSRLDRRIVQWLGMAASRNGVCS